MTAETTTNSSLPVLVVGAARGIGRALVGQFVENGTPVVAGCSRFSDVEVVSSELNGSSGMAIHIDVRSPTVLADAEKRISDRFAGLSGFILCAGTTADATRDASESKGPVGKLTHSAFREVLDTNTVGPALAFQMFAPLLLAGGAKYGIFLSSVRGSLALTDTPSSISYAVSKAALNMFVQKVSRDPAFQSMTIVAVHPGWVSSDLGGPEAPRTPKEGALDIIRLASDLPTKASGRLINYDGQHLPW